MDKFTKSYIETALWSSTDRDGTPLDSSYSAADLAPETLARIIEDCTRFQSTQRIQLVYRDEARAGHDFWLTRNRYGAGFWDGDYPEPQATQLTEESHRFGEVDLYVGDDGKLYLG